MRTAGGGEGDAAGLRRLLLALVLVGITGLAAELVLLEHVESWQQWIPLVVLALGFAAAAAAMLRPTRAVVRALRAAMLAFVLAGAAGIWLHYTGNAAFEREMERGLGGLTLVWRALRGATPALAPGALAQLGLLGLAITWRHPALAPHPHPSTGPIR